jgi:hypothetical protein
VQVRSRAPLTEVVQVKPHLRPAGHASQRLHAFGPPLMQPGAHAAVCCTHAYESGARLVAKVVVFRHTSLPTLQK